MANEAMELKRPPDEVFEVSNNPEEAFEHGFQIGFELGLTERAYRFQPDKNETSWINYLRG